MSKEKAFLIILDGWGHGKIPAASAIEQADTPCMDSLYTSSLHSELTTFGPEVGLPEGQMGNSEVGHINLGAGRIVYQELARINNAIKDKSLDSNATLLQAIDHAKNKNKPIHLLGLLSDGGVHSHIEHLKALCAICNAHQVPGYIHAFMDGRDTAPDGGLAYLQELLNSIKDTSVQLSSMIGRYYAMDRDKRWERIRLAYDLLVSGKGERSDDPLQAIQDQYKNGKTDEFLEPVKFISSEEGTIKDGDVVLFFNFRTDRPRQLTEVLMYSSFPDQGMKPLDLQFYTMTQYSENYTNIPTLFQKDIINNTLGQVLSANNLSQLRIAETEKYPHVTFFFSGGREEEFTKEQRKMVNSPKVATYDLQPEMSAPALTKSVIEGIESEEPAFICLNFANTDMVGHTGIMEAAIKAAETVDACLSQIIPLAKAHNYHIFIIADHGNADIMQNPDGSVHTAHTTNPVPFIYVHENSSFKKAQNGKLADIAPTILHCLGLEIPTEMTGNILLE